ncbi:MAG TPA: glutamine synthetase III [Clostridiales bacterium]|nr:glutamine synthetase III [Clostridiales bacterium]
MSKCKVSEMFGCNVFNEAVMKERLPKDTYRSLKETMEKGLSLDSEIAQIVANAMKDWAVEKGATHYTHWFQPLTGITAEKHDSFLSPTADGKALMEFSGKSLIMGEPDASSFPSGGLRATFEARGYTAWDPTSYAFVNDNTLYIPTAFCSYTGEVLDKKTPLLRSMEALNKEALRVLKCFDNPAKRVLVNVGPEQEYFLVDRGDYIKRKDLMLAGRTLFGAAAPKGQELDDHYFGTIKDRVSAFMQDVDEQLWSLGIYSSTKHNEVAPAQHEFAPIYTTANLAADQNQLAMIILKKTARKHQLSCLLHEKPFAGINGSGKHNNWSMATDTGENLLDPGKDPKNNKQFLVILCAVLKAIDEYSDLLRLSVASAGNDHRLGANEAPPAIISVFLGEFLAKELNDAVAGSISEAAAAEIWNSGVPSLPTLNKDNTDRNRTSPFAFTGNKFEFRMPGAAMSISDINCILNTMVAETLSEAALLLEKSPDIETAAATYIADTVAKHNRIIFNGNNYAAEWVAEAEKRGLSNRKDTPTALKQYVSEKSIHLMTKHGILTKEEVISRYEVMLDNYIKAINIEALTMLHMAKEQILPAVLRFEKTVFKGLNEKKTLMPGLVLKEEEAFAGKLVSLSEKMFADIAALEKAVTEKDGAKDSETAAKTCTTAVIPAMNGLRATADALEVIVDKSFWPIPDYTDLLFNV